jgi:sporulation protein YlmC with PRC-barrel domain
MKSLLIGCIAATTIGVAAAAAADTTTPAAAPSAASDATTPSEMFIDKQDMGLVRAPKLVGVAVYDSNNKSVGKIDDILLDHSGEVKAVVIGVGGFLGIGKKDVAVPYSSIHWQTEQRSVATSDSPAANPANPAGNSGAMTGTADKPVAKRIDPAATEAYQGYPDRAVIDVSQAQLKSAPEFKYAENPEQKMDATAPATPGTPAQKQ